MYGGMTLRVGWISAKYHCWTPPSFSMYKFSMCIFCAYVLWIVFFSFPIYPNTYCMVGTHIWRSFSTYTSFLCANRIWLYETMEHFLIIYTVFFLIFFCIYYRVTHTLKSIYPCFIITITINIIKTPVCDLFFLSNNIFFKKRLLKIPFPTFSI